MGPPMGRGWVVAGLALALFCTALRVHNAFDYPPDKGFDAVAKWEYVARLMEEWILPAPDAFWAAAHPPLFYASAAAIGRALGRPEQADVVVAVRLIGAALGLGVVALAVWLVRGSGPEPGRRAFLAAGLLLLLPVQVYTSAMLSEEPWVAALISLTVFGVILDLGRPEAERSLTWPALIGVAGGLALLTKPSGALGIAAAGGAYAIHGWRRRDLRGGLGRAALLGATACAVGGWFYARNWIGWGYWYPQGLDLHAIMRSMPPGARGVADYLWPPAATWLDPRQLHPDLLHSVWGSTYASAWFDIHRHFLPRHGERVLELGRWMMWLGLLPTAAFVYGTVRGLRRAWRSAAGPDTALLLLLGLTLAGYVLFTWRNPQFVTVKASYLLGLSLPFAYYASEGLAVWTRPGRWWMAPVWLYLALLALLSAGLFWHGLLFAKLDDPGVQWLPVLERPVAPES